MIEEIKVKKIIAIVVAVLLLAGIALILINHLLYRFIFNSDRITGTIHVTLDGEEYDLKDGDVTGCYESNVIGIEFSKTTDGAKVSTRGGDYGPYELWIHIEGLASPLKAVVFQYNWWNVVEFDLTVSIDSAAEKITIRSKAKVLFNSSEEHTSEFNLSDEYIGHYIVSI